MYMDMYTYYYIHINNDKLWHGMGIALHWIRYVEHVWCEGICSYVSVYNENDIAYTYMIALLSK